MSRKILFITDIGSPWGGSEELWSKSASQLKKNGFEVSCSAGFFGEIHPKLQKLKDEGCDLLLRKNFIRKNAHKLKSISSRFKNLPILGGIENHILKVKPDLIVFSQSSGFSMYKEMNFCHQKGFKCISVTQLNSEYSWPTDSNFREIRKANELALQNYFVSHGNMNLFFTQIAKELSNCSVISNPFNFDKIQQIEWPKEDIFHFAFVGRLDFTHKGIDTLLKVFSHPKWEDRNAQLNIYGSGNKELAQELVQHLRGTKIVFHGHVDGIINLWRKNHILVMASRYEGMPLSMIEAMFCQRPVVATPVAGHPEFITHLKNGFLAQGTSADLLGETVEEAWNERGNWKKMGEQAAEIVQAISTNDPVSVFTEKIKAYLV